MEPRVLGRPCAAAEGSWRGERGGEREGRGGGSALGGGDAGDDAVAGPPREELGEGDAAAAVLVELLDQRDGGSGPRSDPRAQTTNDRRGDGVTDRPPD